MLASNPRHQRQASSNGSHNIGTAAILWLLAFCGTMAALAADTRFEFTQPHMGIPVRVVVYASSEADANAAANLAFSRIAALERIFSDYDAESEASLLVQQPVGTSIAVSQELFYVLAATQALSQHSHGAFDVTIGPLTQLWRQARRQRQRPAADAIAAALARVGQQHIELNAQAPQVTCQRPGLQLDFGGCVKGYAAQHALNEIRRHGFPSALVALDGDIALADPPPNQPGWIIDVAPLTPGGPPTQRLQLRHTSVSTSGDAFQFVEIDGIRYSHIVNPCTGLGLTHRSSVTVVHPDGLTADSLATALTVLDPAAGDAVAESYPGVAVLRVLVMDGVPQVQSNPAFKAISAPVD